MATIWNFSEAYANSVWWGNYEPYWQSIADRIYPGETYIGREMIMNNLSWNYERRIGELERELRSLTDRLRYLEDIVWWDHQNRLNELEKSAWFSYIDLNKW